MDVRSRLSNLSKCQAIILGKQYDLKRVTDILHAIDKRQELWRYCEVSLHTIRDWLQTVFKKVTFTLSVHNAHPFPRYELSSCGSLLFYGSHPL